MRKFAALGLLTYLVSSVAIAQSHPEIPKRPQALRELDGHWIMSGDVMGKPVTYRMTAGPTLQGAFTEMHMNDVQRPSQYEARVLIGYDPKADRLIVHWIDSFGAAYSIPHGSGSIDGNTLRFTFAYPSGPFRDTLAFHPGSKTWTLVIEASKADGSWQHFARYDIRREPAKPAGPSGKPH
ncbi:DUF1579 family protein [Dyella ginsengisoli]|uniref:DUF1579 family protein n=1 Tax=Dyella ginsengisoli TaxID=363848 RepID=UPI00034912A9|nr:DUF1579 family protein [Dyella ginsengisoli]